MNKNHDPLLQSLPGSDLAEAVAELLDQASQSPHPGARALVDLAAAPGGRDRIASFCQETMRAFGVCAHGIAADPSAQSALLRQIMGSHPGLEWALSCYRRNIALSDINGLLSNNQALREHAHQRLNQWLSAPQA